jgi:SAM-dependent methyltransferase
MIAPRQKLWSTPISVVERLVESMPLSPSDRVVDVGCGDGRVILQWAAYVSLNKQDDFPSFIGIDIDSDRIQKAQSMLAQNVEDGKIDRDINISFVSANALEQRHLFQDATVFFLYLIPRGLRIIHPMLRQILTSSTVPLTLRVATYMAPLPDEHACNTIKTAVPHQPGAQWPLYLYHLESK